MVAGAALFTREGMSRHRSPVRAELFFGGVLRFVTSFRACNEGGGKISHSIYGLRQVV